MGLCHRREESHLQCFIERFGALFGAISMLGGMLGWMLLGEEAPAVSESTAAEVVAHYVEESDSAFFGGWLLLVLGVLALFFGVWLNSAMRDRGATLLAAGASMGTVMIAVGQAIDGTMNIILGDAADTLPEASVVTLSSITEYLGWPYIMGGIMLMVCVGASAKQTGLIPSWLVWVGYAAAIVILIPAEVAFIGFLLWLLWMVASGITMFRRAGAAA